MTVATFVFLGLARTRPRTHRLFYYITGLITMVAAIAYFTMGANLGFTPIPVGYQRSNPRVHGTYREIFYVRYIDWYVPFRNLTNLASDKGKGYYYSALAHGLAPHCCAAMADYYVHTGG